MGGGRDRSGIPEMSHETHLTMIVRNCLQPRKPRFNPGSVNVCRTLKLFPRQCSRNAANLFPYHPFYLIANLFLYHSFRYIANLFPYHPFRRTANLFPCHSHHTANLVSPSVFSLSVFFRFRPVFLTLNALGTRQVAITKQSEQLA